MTMRSDRASDLGWTNEVREALRRPNVGPLSARRTWRDVVRVGMMRAAVAGGILAWAAVVWLALEGFVR